MLRVRVTGQTLHMEEDWFVRKDGSLVPVAYSSAPFRDGDGWGAVITFRDITERLRLEESTRREAIERAHAEDARRSRGASPRPPMRLGSRSNATSTMEPSSSSSLSACVLKRLGRPLGTTPIRRGGHRTRAERAPRGAPGASRTGSGDPPGGADGRGLGAALRGSPAGARSQVSSTSISTPIGASHQRSRCARTLSSPKPSPMSRACKGHARHDPCRGTPGVGHVLVADDGVGGATFGVGSGLTGARDRVDALGGTLVVSSPPGGPTILTGTLPFASSGRAPA